MSFNKREFTNRPKTPSYHLREHRRWKINELHSFDHSKQTEISHYKYSKCMRSRRVFSNYSNVFMRSVSVSTVAADVKFFISPRTLRIVCLWFWVSRPPNQVSCQKKKRIGNQTFWETRWLQYLRSGDWDWNFGRHLVGWRAIFSGMSLTVQWPASFAILRVILALSFLQWMTSQNWDIQRAQLTFASRAIINWFCLGCFSWFSSGHLKPFYKTAELLCSSFVYGMILSQLKMFSIQGPRSREGGTGEARGPLYL